MPAVKVFVAGSRALSRLNDAVRKRLDRIISEEHQVLIGDANGADRIVQQYFADHHYRNVTVFCTGGRCRNNVGQWTTVAIAPPLGVHSGRDFYAVKDQEMAAKATHGLMLWDGESRGTFANIRNLVRDSKPVVVYLSPAKEFINVKTPADIDALLAQAAPAARNEVRRRA
jgi:hypothetical protein